MPELIQIRASAGSGKTYTLAMNYMARLAQAGGGSSLRDLSVRAAEILAITFTNAAAEEMRQRVIVNLKRAALGRLNDDEEQPLFPKNLARKWLQVFLDDMNALNIRTIDSLLHQIIRSCALDLNLDPEYETVFDTAEALAPHVDKMLENSRTDAELRGLLSRACEAVIYSDNKASFSRGQRIRDDLDNVLSDVMADKFENLTPPGELQKRLEKMKADAVSLASQMTALMGDPIKNKVNIPAWKVLTAIAAAGEAETHGSSGAPWAKGRACFQRNDVQALYNKGGTPPDGMAELYARLRELFYMLGPADALAHEAARYYPLVETARAVARYFDQEAVRDAVLPQARAAMLASSVLKPIGEVSTALCRMGGALRHYLVDEFQDTSLEQWNVLQALALEALSQGGSMVWVGDPKQSIYGWRGGNPELFDAVAADRQLLAVAGVCGRNPLEHNWRSCPNVVKFNNELFAPLGDKAGAAAALQAMLGDCGGYVLDAAAGRVAKAFGDIEQKLPPEKEYDFPGCVRVDSIAEENAEDTRREAMERLVKLLTDEIRPRRPWRDVLILVRSNDSARRIAERLALENIPAITDNGLVLKDNLLVRQIAAFLQFLDNPRNEAALWAVLSGAAFAEFDAAGAFSLEDFTGVAAQRGNKPLDAVFAESYPEIWEKLLRPFFHQAAMLTPYDLVMEWTKRLKIQERFPADATMLRRFMETVHRAEGAGYGSLSEFLIYWQEKGGDGMAPMPAGMNAVRIMTIHKAKGLEAPVAIIPGTSFALNSSDKIQAISHDALGKAAVKVRSAMGRAYQEDMCRQAQEALNLLYVAFTRAREELYIFHTEAGKNGGKGTASAATGFLLSRMDGSASFGSPPETGAPLEEDGHLPAEPQSAVDDAPPDWRPMGWLPHLKIFYTPVRGKMSSREEGILVHAALANWRPAASLPESMELALQVAQKQTGYSPGSAVLKQIRRWLNWLLGHEKIRSWLLDAMPEQPLMDADGKYMRADLLVPLPSGCLVADFKTGHPREKDILQVQNYMRCVSASGQFPGKVKGLLIYMAWERFQLITGEGSGALQSVLPGELH